MNKNVLAYHAAYNSHATMAEVIEIMSKLDQVAPNWADDVKEPMTFEQMAEYYARFEHPKAAYNQQPVNEKIEIPFHPNGPFATITDPILLAELQEFLTRAQNSKSENPTAPVATVDPGAWPYAFIGRKCPDCNQFVAVNLEGAPHDIVAIDAAYKAMNEIYLGQKHRDA